MLNKLLLGIICALSVLARLPTALAQDSSAQFISKLYTEALGRVPDDSAFQSDLSNISTNGCNLASMTNLATNVLESQEYANDYLDNGSPDNGSKVAGLYRAVLNREPDMSGWLGNVNSLNAGSATWSQVVKGVLSSPEFGSLVTNSICAKTTPGASQTGSYGWGGGQPFDRQVAKNPIAIPDGSTEAALQTTLSNTAPGGTVYLNPGTVTNITSTLLIPDGITLATAPVGSASSSPAPRNYLQMARLVRTGSSASFPGFVIEVAPGAALRNIWVDGARATFTNAGANCDDDNGEWSCSNIAVDGNNSEVNPATGKSFVTQIINNRISDSYGNSNLTAFGTADATPSAPYSCGPSYPTEQITGNLSTQYATSHFVTTVQPGFPWSDGLSISCENANVVSNEVVDATDTGIVLFGGANAAVQASKITSNIILNAGNAAFGSLYVDTRATGVGACTNGTAVSSFSGSLIESNELYTGPNTFVQAAIALGIQLETAGCTGSSLSVLNNNDGSNFVRDAMGIAIDGVHNSVLNGNNFTLQSASHGSCPVGSFLEEPGTVGINTNQPPGDITSAQMNGCISALPGHN